MSPMGAHVPCLALWTGSGIHQADGGEAIPPETWGLVQRRRVLSDRRAIARGRADCRGERVPDHPDPLPWQQVQGRNCKIVESK